MIWKDEYKSNGYATHQLVLEKILEINNKPILELGCGDGSTEMISYYSNKKSLKTISVESDKLWLDKYLHFTSNLHEFINLHNFDDWLDYYDTLKYDFGLVFVDQSNWSSRTDAVNYFKNKSDYIILHDCDWFATNNELGFEKMRIIEKNNVGERNYDKTFKYWIEYFPEYWFGKTGPPTLLGSNIIDVKNIII